MFATIKKKNINRVREESIHFIEFELNDIIYTNNGSERRRIVTLLA